MSYIFQLIPAIVFVGLGTIVIAILVSKIRKRIHAKKKHNNNGKTTRS